MDPGLKLFLVVAGVIVGIVILFVAICKIIRAKTDWIDKLYSFGVAVGLLSMYAIIRATKTNWVEKWHDFTKPVPDLEKGHSRPEISNAATDPYTRANRLRAEIDRSAALNTGASHSASVTPTAPAPAFSPNHQNTL